MKEAFEIILVIAKGGLSGANEYSGIAIACVLIYIARFLVKFDKAIDVKQKECDGKFNLIDSRHNNLKEDVDETKKDIKEVKNSVSSIEKNVSSIELKLEDKFKSRKHAEG